jgi:Asp-tRNA(Asn)/Glu-tRNA(Gln) amidotransferase A subunit family amidase
VSGDVLSGVLLKRCRFASLANFVGLPGISVPSGYDAHGLPIGFQAMAGHWNEHVLLRVAHALEGRVALQKPGDMFFSPL